MFFSLNKKFIYTVSTFFLFTATIFFYAFYLINDKKIQEEQKAIIQQNQQQAELLYENVALYKELSLLRTQHPELKFSPEIEKLTLNTQLKQQPKHDTAKNDDERYKALIESFKIMLITLSLFFLALIVLWILIKIWILVPIQRLANVSQTILSGNYTSRLKLPPSPKIRDEFDNLMQTFNNMLDNIENGIKEIHQTETFLQSIIDSIPDGIRVLDEDGTIIIANKEYYKQIGSSENCIGKKCYESSQCRNTPCPHSLFTCPLREITAPKNTNIKFIQQFSAFPNRHLSINAAPMIIDGTNNKKKRYIVESIRDLSDDIRFSHQQKLSSLGFLATSVAHEMKNHLGSIRMITEGLLKKHSRNKTDEEETQYLSLINKQLIECINVPERLLKMAHFSPEEKNSFSLNNCIQDIISLLDYEAKRNGIIIEFQYPKKEIIISGNESDFKMMLINLLQNSLKAMPNSGKLTIKLGHTSSKDTKIEIKDTGIGIPKDKLPRIFEPFYSQKTASEKDGTGLGLAIAKSIVDKFAGEITVTSKQGKGTCFCIKIPANAEK